MKINQPRKRSKIRLKLGKTYYTYRRYIQWYIGRKNYVKTKDKNKYMYIVTDHKTPLLRKLKDVDMWLQYNKIKNLKNAVKCINNIVIKPKETFSFWRLVGKPSTKKGYVEGMVIDNGKVSTGIGGGLCQLTNLIYWMTLHTPLNITERYRHAFDVFPDANRKQPFGSGATCVYNYCDLQIYNGTSIPYQLNIYLDKEFLYGEWRTNKEILTKYKVYEKNHYIRQEYWGGYVRHNEIYRKAFNELDEIIGEEFIVENDAIMMYSPLLEANIS